MRQFHSTLATVLIPLLLASPAMLNAQDKDETPSEVEKDSKVEEQVKEKAKVLEVMTVTGQKSFVEPSSNTVVTSEQLETYKYTDLNRILKTVPGVQIQEEDGFGLRPNIGMRGVAPHRSRKVLIMEDGIPSGPAPYAAPAAYYVPAMTLINGVEVNKGSSAVRYGPQTIGGAINLITKKIPDAPWAADIDLGMGSYNFRKAIATVGGKQGSWGWMLLGAQMGSDGYKNLPNGHDTGFHKRDLMGKLTYDLTSTQKIFFTGIWSDELSDESYLGLTRSDFDQDPYQRYAASERDQMKNGHRSFSLGHEWKGETTTSRLTLYSRGFDRNWQRLDGVSDRGVDIRNVLMNPVGANQHIYDVLRGADDSLGSNDLIFQAINHRIYESRGIYWEGSHKTQISDGIKNEVEWGLRSHKDSIRHDHTSKSFAMISGSLFDSGEADLVGAQDKISADTLSAHVWDTLSLGDLRLSAGIRHEWVNIEVDDFSAANADEKNKRSASMPGAGVFYQINPTLGALFGVYRGLGLAAADDKGSGDAEESINYEAGFRWLKDSNALDLIGFWNDYKNIKGTCAVSEGCGNATADISYNGGEALIYGLEFSGSTTPNIGNVYFPLSFEYTLTRASFQNNFVSGLNDWGIGLVREGDPIPYVPEHQLGVQAAVQWEAIRFGLQTKYQSMSYDQALLAGREKVPSSTILDSSLSYFVSDKYEVYATADNLTNRKALVSYRAFGARPGKPQSFVFGVKASMN